jgi:hypothetical protein
MQCQLDALATLEALAPCVQGVRGHFRRAQSPSDVWWLTFKPGTLADKQEVYTAVLKYFSRPKTFGGLGYELKVYELVRTWLRAEVTPNFVPTLATFPHVTSRELKRLLRADPRFEPGWDESLQANLDSISSFRGSAVMLAVDQPLSSGSSSFGSTPRRKRKERREERRELVLSAILTEAMPQSLSLDKRLAAHELQGPDFAAILFQLVSLCFVMQCAKMVHGDLHSQNVMVVAHDAPVTLAYLLEDRTFEFKTWYTAHVFDFDRSFVAVLGPNPHFKAHKLQPQYDLLTLLCFVAGRMYADQRMDPLLYKAQQDLLHDVFGAELVNGVAEQFDAEEGPCRNLQAPERPQRSLLEYLDRLERYLQPSEYYAPDVFVCRESMFDASGQLKPGPVVFNYGGRTVTRM